MPFKDKEKAKAWRKQWWSSLPTDRKKQMQEKANNRAKLIRIFLAEYKLKTGCVDCGYNKHHTALDFDHIGDDKHINVCNAKSITQAKKEIKKCEVVCSNCHRIRTYNRIYPCKPDIFKLTYDSLD